MQELKDWEGALVRLSAAGRKERLPEMETWEGYVAGTVRFEHLIRNGDGGKETYFRLLVDWGDGKLWTEDPALLVRM